MKKRMLIIGVLISLVLVSIVVNKGINRSLKCTRSEELIEGINSEEELRINIKKEEIKRIELKREIKLNEFYDEYETYYDSIEDILIKAYEYLDKDLKIERKEKKLEVKIDTKEKGINLNNLKIKYNGEDKTTLRYDAVTNLGDVSSIKVKENKTKKGLKEELKRLGYTCK